MVKKTITVFTPTYNRGYCISKVYKSLLKQNNKDFHWLIIDDGSSDNTKALVQTWMEEGLIDIEYIYKENGGMLSAHNTAYDNISTELNVCIDSDDYLTDNAIDIIIKYWRKYSKDNHAGMLGLDIDIKGNVLGITFPENLIDVKFSDLKRTYKNLGDKKFIYRTEIINKYPRFPTVKNEKFPAAGLLYRRIDKDYDLLAINEPLCVVEYMPDGNSKNKISQYKKNPNAFAIYRLERMKLATDFLDKFKNSIHYVSSCLIGKRKNIVSNSPNKFITILSLPFGLILYFYIMNTKRKGIIK
ncbi:MAG: glycosyltransferase family 2 protein [Pedobacter sp.]|nr:MAG: glycosyltransferase family 2 protein [Pedobacter sp.]